MRITLTTERGESVSFDLRPGENAWITTEDGEQTSRSLYLDPSSSLLGTGEVDTTEGWWDWASPLHLVHEAVVPTAAGVPPRCTCGYVGGNGIDRPLLADHLREYGEA